MLQIIEIKRDNMLSKGHQTQQVTIQIIGSRVVNQVLPGARGRGNGQWLVNCTEFLFWGTKMFQNQMEVTVAQHCECGKLYTSRWLILSSQGFFQKSILSWDRFLDFLHSVALKCPLSPPEKRNQDCVLPPGWRRHPPLWIFQREKKYSKKQLNILVQIEID